MTLLEINPFVRYVDRRDSYSCYKTFVKAYDYRLFYVEKGSFMLHAENECYTIKSGQISIIPPSTAYRIVFNKPCRFYVVNFDVDTKKHTVTEAIEPRPENEYDYNLVISDKRCSAFPAVLECDEQTRMLVPGIYDLYYQKNDFSDASLSALLKLIIAKAFIHTSREKALEIIKNIMYYIENHYREELSNQKLGELFSYHPNYLNRLFKTYTGKSLHNYIIDYRLSRAVYLMGENFSVNEICKKCGFTSYSYFIKKFREKYGEPPLQFKNRRNRQMP